MQAGKITLKTRKETVKLLSMGQYENDILISIQRCANRTQKRNTSMAADGQRSQRQESRSLKKQPLHCKISLRPS
jgi:hypothetical protein